MRLPTIHLIITSGKSACGKKKGVGMGLIDFKKEIKAVKNNKSIMPICGNCEKLVPNP